MLLFDVPRPMALHGRILLATLMRVLRQTYCVKEPLANQRKWEEQTKGVFEESRRLEGIRGRP